MAGNYRGASRGIELGDVAGVSGVTDLFRVGPKSRPREVRAYAEGRANTPAANPHAAGSEAAKAWDWGKANLADSAYAYETAVP